MQVANGTVSLSSRQASESVTGSKRSFTLIGRADDIML